MKLIFCVTTLIGMAVRPPVPAEDAPSPVAGTFQEIRWSQAEIKPEWQSRVDGAVDRYLRTRGRYEILEDLRRAPSVPSRVIFVLHGRESTWSFSKHLHEGSSLKKRTRWVPKDRPKKGTPPFTFEESAEDALYTLKGMHEWNWVGTHSTLQNIETYNGLGYQKYHKDVPSPYLWSGTTIYSRGKYVADGKFSKLAIDKQIGCAAILLRMKERGVR